VLLRHTGNPAEIHRAFFKELYPGQPAPAGIPDKGKSLEQLAVQPIIRIPPGEIFLLTECLQRGEATYKGLRR